MTHRRPTLGRRLLPAVALTGVGFGLVHALDRPLVATGTGDAVPLADPSSTTLMPVGDTSTSTTVVVAAVPQTAPAASSVPAPATTAVPASNTCGAIVTTGSQASIYERRQYGVIAVTARFTGSGTLCKVSAKYQVYDRRSQRYEEWAVPILNKQATKARSANINGISGATAVSRAYAQSLQSAIDQKG